MKKFIIITSFVFTAGKMLAQTTNVNGSSFNPKFIAAVQNNLKILDTAATAETFIMLANNFERIGKAEQKQWQPFYYAAFCYALIAGNTKDKASIDALEDKAESYLSLAEDLDKNNSEISSLYAMILYSRVLVDPISRWQTIGSQAAVYIEKAKQQNPTNPRPYLIEGRKILHTPEGLGGGAKAAKPVIENCMKKFNDFVPDNLIAPVWGKKQAEKLMQSINPQ